MYVVRSVIEDIMNTMTANDEARYQSNKRRRSTWEHRVILLGDAGVGKTSLFRRFMGDPIPRSTQTAHITPDSHTRTFIFNDKTVDITLCDTGGMERHRNSLTDSYFRNISAAIFVFSKKNRFSLNEIQSSWLPQVTNRMPYKENPGKVKLFLVMNQADESYANEEDPEFVTQTEMETCAKNGQHEFENCFTVSAKSNSGVSEMFESIASRLSVVIRDDMNSFCNGDKIVLSNSPNHNGQKFAQKVKQKCCT